MLDPFVSYFLGFMVREHYVPWEKLFIFTLPGKGSQCFFQKELRKHSFLYAPNLKRKPRQVDVLLKICLLHLGESCLGSGGTAGRCGHPLLQCAKVTATQSNEFPEEAVWSVSAWQRG